MADLSKLIVVVEMSEELKTAIDNFDKRLKRIENSLFGRERIVNESVDKN